MNDVVADMKTWSQHCHHRSEDDRECGVDVAEKAREAIPAREDTRILRMYRMHFRASILESRKAHDASVETRYIRTAPIVAAVGLCNLIALNKKCGGGNMRRKEEGDESHKCAARAA